MTLTTHRLTEFIKPRPGRMHSRNPRFNKEYYRNGYALKHHMDIAHGGQIDDKCLACKEISAKQTAIQ